MENQYLKKIIAQSPEDLNVISACCSEGRVNIKDVKYLASNKIFLMSILRLSKEEENKNKRIAILTNGYMLGRGYKVWQQLIENGYEVSLS